MDENLLYINIIKLKLTMGDKVEKKHESYIAIMHNIL
jgi:hypothetical protein